MEVYVVEIREKGIFFIKGELDLEASSEYTYRVRALKIYLGPNLVVGKDYAVNNDETFSDFSNAARYII